MNPSALPILGPVIHNGKDILKKIEHLISIENKKVLLIGYSELEISEYITPWHPSEIVCLTNWQNHQDAEVSTYKLVIGDLCVKSEFLDSEFDCVITLSVLEHLWNLESAFLEVKRILKPNGAFVNFFGPVWSSVYGHHLYVNPNDQNLNFTFWQLPAHIHLLSTHNEISDWYTNNGYSLDTVKWVLDGLYTSNIINRLPFEKYLELSCTYFQLYWIETMYNILPSYHLENLYKQCGPGDYSTYGASLTLINSKKSE